MIILIIMIYGQLTVNILPRGINWSYRQALPVSGRNHQAGPFGIFVEHSDDLQRAVPRLLALIAFSKNATPYASSVFYFHEPGQA